MIAAYLREHGFDGLAGENCGCVLDDLMPCGEVSPEYCETGRRVPCPGPGYSFSNGCEYGGGCGWHVVPASEEIKIMSETHVEKPGHCPSCAAELEQLKQRVEDLDRTLAAHIRATPATPLEEMPEPADVAVGAAP